MKKLLLASIASVVFAAGCANAEAFKTPEKGTIKLDVRLTTVVPDESGKIYTAAGADSGLHVGIGNSVVPTIGLEYYLSPSLSIEAIAGVTPHKVKAQPAGVTVAQEWILPPVISLKYHFSPASQISPYVGAGVNYMFFYDQKGKNGFHVDLENGFGWALQGGVDIATNGPWSINLDVKKVFFETDARINYGALKSKVTIDPLVASVGFGYKF